MVIVVSDRVFVAPHALSFDRLRMVLSKEKLVELLNKTNYVLFSAEILLGVARFPLRAFDSEARGNFRGRNNRREHAANRIELGPREGRDFAKNARQVCCSLRGTRAVVEEDARRSYRFTFQ